MSPLILQVSRDKTRAIKFHMELTQFIGLRHIVGNDESNNNDNVVILHMDPTHFWRPLYSGSHQSAGMRRASAEMH